MTYLTSCHLHLKVHQKTITGLSQMTVRRCSTLSSRLKAAFFEAVGTRASVKDWAALLNSTWDMKRKVKLRET
jgi:hypothetical protein